MTNNQRLSNEELAQIKERAEKATEGNWFTVAETIVQCEGPDTFEYDADHIGECEREDDATFIAHAREDIPKLIAEVEYRREKQAELLEYNRQYFAEIKRLRAEIARLEMEALK